MLVTYTNILSVLIVIPRPLQTSSAQVDCLEIASDIAEPLLRLQRLRQPPKIELRSMLVAILSNTRLRVGTRGNLVSARVFGIQNYSRSQFWIDAFGGRHALTTGSHPRSLCPLRRFEISACGRRR